MDLALLPQLIANGIISGSLYALVSVGLTLNYGVLKILNFAHGHLMMVGAYLFYLFYVQYGVGIGISSVASVGCAVGIGAIVLKLFVQPFTRFSYQLPIVTTLALSIILEAIISLAFGVNVKSLSTSFSESEEFLGVFITPFQIGIVFTAILVFIFVGILVHSTPMGRVLRAVREHRQAAESLGISEKRVTLGVFVLATLLATLAGVMIGFETNLQPTMGSAHTIKAFAAMILGGLGNMWGTVVGAFILGMLENFSIGFDFGGYSLPAGYKDAFSYLVILIVLLVKPSGIFGERSRKV